MQTVSVLLCTYISLGLVFAPKMAYIYRVPHSKDEQSGGLGRSKLTKAEQNRFQQLLVENEELKKQIEIVRRLSLSAHYFNYEIVERSKDHRVPRAARASAR